MNKLCLVACDVRSAHNVGSFLRTADGFSADVFLVGITPYPKLEQTDSRLPHIATKANLAISKTALGAEKTVNWRYFPTIHEALTELKELNYVIVAIEQDKKSKILNDSSFTNGLDYALIVGPEVEGLDSEVINQCDEIYEIAMSGQKESFNVSIAAAIALYQARKSLC